MIYPNDSTQVYTNYLSKIRLVLDHISKTEGAAIVHATQVF